MTDKTGGPAFPVNGYSPDFNGMTLRDYFAAKAMEAIMTRSSGTPFPSVANYAYAQADAMLKAREQ